MYSFSNAAIAFAYFIIPILLLPLFQQAQGTIRLNLLLAIAFVFSCGVGHTLEAFHLHLVAWHFVTAIVSWTAVIALVRSQAQLHYIAKTFQLLDTTWNKSITGKLLFEKQDDDFRLLKANPIGLEIWENFLQVGDLLGQKLPSLHHIKYPHNLSLIELYQQTLASGQSQQIEFHLEDPLKGHYLNIFVPLSDTLLYATFLDITPLKYDALTGLYNRRILDTETQKWQSCLYIDLDRFKLLNDQRGHKLGDKILIAVAEILRTHTKMENGIAIREGGDEFLLLLPHQDVYPVAASILEGIQAIEIDGASISASMGIASNYTEGFEESEYLERLQQAAETATREAKRDHHSESPKNRIRQWDSELACQYARKIAIEANLARKSIEEEWWLVYQPICSLATGEVIGAEALIRWNSPQLGMISPGEFIPIAETTGLIFNITDWVLCQALTQLAQWNVIAPNFWVSINLSPVELEDKDFTDRLHRRITDAKVSAQLVGLEITERSIYKNLERYRQSLQYLQDMSIRLKVDDFGTGQSGLAQLLQFHFDEIKVDRSFIPSSPQDTDQLAICEAVVTLAQGMGFYLVAEGVETAFQRKLLMNLGYKYGQGYFFAKPMIADSLTQILRNRTRLPYSNLSSPEYMETQ